MAKRLFGTDGVRGVANLEPMTAETALRLEHWLTALVNRGKDTEFS
jgi:phosphoglucosamine mutase